jgi:hypothetical protein
MTHAASTPPPSPCVQASFPAAVLRGVNARATKAKAAAGAFVSPREAQAEASNPSLAYGQPLSSRRQLAPLPGRRPGAGGEEPGADPSSFFLTQRGQQPGGPAEQDDERR